MANPANESTAARARATEGASGTAHRTGDDNVVDLIGKLTSQSAHLAQQQVNLVQAEMRETADDIKKGVGALIGAAVLGISGLGVTLMGISYLIGDAIGDRDIATLGVGIVVLVIALIMYSSAKSKMSTANARPDRTIETTERLPHAAQGESHTRTGA